MDSAEPPPGPSRSALVAGEGTMAGVGPTRRMVLLGAPSKGQGGGACGQRLRTVTVVAFERKRSTSGPVRARYHISTVRLACACACAGACARVTSARFASSARLPSLNVSVDHPGPSGHGQVGVLRCSAPARARRPRHAQARGQRMPTTNVRRFPWFAAVCTQCRVRARGCARRLARVGMVAPHRPLAPLGPRATGQMPKVFTSKKRPPPGWETIEPTMKDLEQRMRDGTCVQGRYGTGCGPSPPRTPAPSHLHWGAPMSVYAARTCPHQRPRLVCCRFHWRKLCCSPFICGVRA